MTRVDSLSIRAISAESIGVSHRAGHIWTRIVGPDAKKNRDGPTSVPIIVSAIKPRVCRSGRCNPHTGSWRRCSHYSFRIRRRGDCRWGSHNRHTRRWHKDSPHTARTDRWCIRRSAHHVRGERGRHAGSQRDPHGSQHGARSPGHEYARVSQRVHRSWSWESSSRMW